MHLSILAIYISFSLISVHGCTRCMIKTIPSGNRYYIPIHLDTNTLQSLPLRKYINQDPKLVDTALFQHMNSKLEISPTIKYHLDASYNLQNKENLNDENLDNNLKEFMLSSIKWYKNYLSPILPPRCRFLPTCSSYGLESIQTYGPWKGGILTIWRIIRCNPFGGSGYDPPRWPPPNYFSGSNTNLI